MGKQAWLAVFSSFNAGRLRLGGLGTAKVKGPGGRVGKASCFWLCEVWNPHSFYIQRIPGVFQSSVPQSVSGSTSSVTAEKYLENVGLNKIKNFFLKTPRRQCALYIRTSQDQHDVGHILGNDALATIYAHVESPYLLL